MFRLADTIRRTQSDDGGILLDISQGRMFSLNPVGSKIVESLEQGFDEATIAEQISTTYAVGIETARNDIRDFIETLNKHRILRTQDAPGSL